MAEQKKGRKPATVKVEDEKPVVEKVEEKKVEKVAVFMERGAGWATSSGIVFSREHPFALVNTAEAEYLLKEVRFRLATPEEVKAYYSVEG